jgi:phosphopantothenoylcysteine decarboxylase/phosphopantothenate--cysteine ligase
VADFRPKAPAEQKIKKGHAMPEIVLEPTHDFLVDLGERKPTGQVLVGFAAETEHLLDNARRKLEQKRLDLIVANDVAAPGAGFEHDTNAVVIVARDGSQTEVPLSTKHDIARAVFDAVARVRAETLPTTTGPPQQADQNRSTRE